MLDLNNNLLINTGTNRACFMHPTDSLKCIKIDIKNNKETIREKRYYMFLQKNKVSFEMIANYYGTVYTSMGKGEVFELIKDYDGNISQELDKLLLNKNISELDLLEINKNISLFKKYIFMNKIYVKDLNPVNVVFQRITEKKGRLVIIDGLAHSNYNPFFYNTNYFILKKINKSWNSFINNVEEKISLIKEKK